MVILRGFSPDVTRSKTKNDKDLNSCHSAAHVKNGFNKAQGIVVIHACPSRHRHCVHDELHKDHLSDNKDLNKRTNKKRLSRISTKVNFKGDSRDSKWDPLMVSFPFPYHSHIFRDYENPTDVNINS